MEREGDQELWDLLDQAGDRPTLSPFFARNVVREIRQQPTWRHSLRWWFAPRRLIPASAVALAIVGASVSIERQTNHPRAATTEANAPATAQMAANTQDGPQLDPIDYQVVVDLDDLLAMEDDNLWTDGDTSTL